jgi:hypothetical protein
LCERLFVSVYSLRGIENRQAAVIVPDSNGGVQFDGIVVVARRSVNIINGNLSFCETFVDIADFDLGRFAQNIGWYDRFRL